jgi:hypothetical protein
VRSKLHLLWEVAYYNMDEIFLSLFCEEKFPRNGLYIDIFLQVLAKADRRWLSTAETWVQSQVTLLKIR